MPWYNDIYENNKNIMYISGVKIHSLIKTEKIIDDEKGGGDEIYK